MRWSVVRLIAALLGALGVWLLRDLVRRHFDVRLATWTAGVAAVLPSLVWVGGGLTAESLSVPLVLGAVWAAVRHRDAGGSAPRVAAASVLPGLAVLTRINDATLVLALLVAAWLPRRRWTDPLGLDVVLTPWTVRNAQAFGAFAPLGTQSGSRSPGPTTRRRPRAGRRTRHGGCRWTSRR